MPRHFKRPGLILLLLVFTPLLLSLPLLFQVRSDMAASKFATEAAYPLTDAVTLHLLYPTRLRIEPPDGEGRPLLLWLTTTATEPDDSPYIITLEHDGSLLFTGSGGTVRDGQVVLRTATPAQARHTLVLRQAPLQRDLPETVNLGITLTTPQSTENRRLATLPIALETTTQAHQRRVVSFLANPEALPGLASVLVSLVALVISLKVQRDRENRERHELIQSVNALLESDLPGAIRRLLKLEQQAREQEWEETLLNELRTIRQRLEHERTYHEQLLRHASDAIRQGTRAEERGDSLLELLAHLSSGEMKQHIGLLQAILSPHPPARTPPIAQVIESALWLWHAYDEDGQEIVVQALLWVNRQPGGRDTLREMFHTAMSKERRLLRSPQLKDIAPGMELYYYAWPPLPPAPPHPPDSRVARWLEAHQLTGDPFNAGIAEFDTMLLQTWQPPVQWRAIKSAIPIASIAAVEADSGVAALMLRHELQSAPQQTVFPVWLVLRAGERRTADQRDEDGHGSDNLEALAWACGETWITLLAHNPGTLFDLAEPERLVLAELLLWVASSLNALRLWLRQSGLPENAEGRMLLRRIEEAVGSEPPPTSLSRGKLLQWLRIRPPGLQYTAIIATCQPQADTAACWEHARPWLGATHELAQAGVMLKLVMPPPPEGYHLPPAVNRVMLAWEAEQLKAMLQARLKQCSGTYRRFGELFGPSPLENADDLLIAQANGSLARLLQMGYAVVRLEVEGNSPDAFLSEADLRTVLAKVHETLRRQQTPRLPAMPEPLQRIRSTVQRFWSSFRREP
jgi:hypothetical protein